MTEPPLFPRHTLVIGGAKFPLVEGEDYIVGRNEDCDLRVNHVSVSDHHCRITCQYGEVTVEDLGSTNGTFVGDQPVQRQQVVPGQTVRVGAIELSLHDAAAGPVTVPFSPPVSSRGRQQDRSFNELMREELRRAPWLTLSAVLHVLVFFILYQLMELPLTTGERSIAIDVKREAQDPVIEERDNDPELQIAEEEEVEEELASAGLLQSEPEPPPDDLDGLELMERGSSTGTNWLETVKGKGKDGGVLTHAAVRAGGFGKTVSQIRRTGLEIMFVVDSTGSMDSILQGTKRRIAHMFELLHELVPDAKIGLVTYRDRDSSEDYLTRNVPLATDIYRAINFMQIIDANGGGNRAEAVLDGLREAFQQKWHPKARRVVVLIGDAPAHGFDERKIKRAVSSFASNGRSYVHAIVTSPYGSDSLQVDTQKSFRMIAKAGRGECIGFEDENRVLRQVMSLAFGREYRKNIDEASRVVQDAKSKVATYALSMVRGKDFFRLEKGLRKRPVPDDIVKALCRSTDKDVAKWLVGMMKRADLGQDGRQAGCYALTRILEGRLRDTMIRIFARVNEDGGSQRKPWTLAPLTNRQARRLTDVIDRR